MAKKIKSSGKGFTAKTKKPQTPWLKNAMKSIGVTSSEVLKDLSPNIYEVTSSGVKTVSDLRKISRRGSTSSAMSAIQSNKFVKMGQDTIKNALEDLKTGNLNNKERENRAIEKSMGFDSFFDDFDKDFGTSMDDSDWDEDIDGSPIVQQYVSSGTSDEALITVSNNLYNQINTQTENQLKIAKANLDTMVSISSAQMLQTQELGSSIVNHLENISNSLSSIVEYNNENMNRFIDSSIAFMERMGAKEDNNGDGFTDKIDPTSVYNNGKGGLNISNYKKLVLQQFQKEFKGSTIGFAANLIADNPEMLTSNPVGLISKAVIGSMVPSVIKETISGVEEAFSGFVPSMLAKIADFGDIRGNSLKDNLLRMIGKTFGVKVSRTNAFDLSGTTSNESAVFDKMTRHSIVEIMPKYLRESTVYLKEILSLMGGNVSNALNQAEAFDYQKGRYRSVSDINDDVYGTIRDTVINKMDLSKFGSGLRGRGGNLSKDLENQYDKMLDDFFIKLEQHGKHIDVTNFNQGSDLEKILSSITGDPTVKKYLEAALKVSSKDPSVSLNADVAIQQAVAARNNMIKSMEEDPYSWNLYTAVSDKSEDIDRQIEVMKNQSSVMSAESKKIGTPISLLNDIRTLLDRGINVKVLSGKAFKSTETTEVTTSSKGKRRNKSTPQDQVNEDNEYTIGKDVIDSKTIEDLVEDMQNEDELYRTTYTSTRDRSIQSAGEHIQNAMHAIMYGNSTMAFNEIGSIVGDRIVNVGSKFKKSFIDPMIKSITGEKNQEGYSKNGLLSDVQNKFLDAYRSFQREFSGKGYIDSKGKTVKDKKEGEESVVGNIKNIMKSIKKNTMDYILGEEEVDEEGNPTGKRSRGHGMIGYISDSLKEGFDGFTEFFFGEDSENDKKTQRENIIKQAKEKISKALPSAMTGGIVGGLGGAVAGGSLLGALVGGPIGGALLGSTIGIAQKSNRFQDWLFGKEDEETHERMGGFISKEFQDTLKNNKVNIIGGATIGVAKNAIFGGGGLLGSLVGGPIAGALIGGATGYVVKTKQFQEFLYGSEVTDANGNVKKIGGILNAFNGIFKKSSDKEAGASGKKLLGMSALGAGVGALGAGAIGQMGLMGSMFTPFGPVGGALAGLAFSIKASKKGFNQYLFGSDEFDEDGNLIGHKNGVLQKFGNMLEIELFEPMRDGLANFSEDAQDFIIDKMLAPVEFAIAPAVERVHSIMDAIHQKIDSVIDSGTKFIKDNVLDPIVQITKDAIISPMKKIFGTLFKAIWGVSKMAISAPFSALSLLTNFNDSRNRRDSRRRVMEENRENNGFFGGLSKNLAIRLNIGNARKDAEYKYTDYAEEWDERKRQYISDKEAREADHKARTEERRRNSTNRRLIGRWTGYDQTDDTIENRELAQKNYEEYLRQHPLKTALKSRKLDFYGDPIVINKNGSGLGSGNTTASDALKERDPKKLGIVGGILQEVHKITQVLTGGKSPLGNSNDNPDNSSDDSKSSQYNEHKADYMKDDRENQFDVEDYEEDEEQPHVSRFKRFRNQLKSSLNIKEGWKNSYARNRFISGKNFIKNFRFPGFADGTEDAPPGFADGTEDAPPGFAVVGERGPELVNFSGGEQVTPHEKPINVNLVDMEKGVLGKLRKIFANLLGTKKKKNIDPNKLGEIIEAGGENVLDGVIDNEDGDTILDALNNRRNRAESDAALERVRNAKNYEANQKARKELEKEEREKEQLSVIKKQEEESKTHFNLWSSIFSKKGLITGGLIALSPFIIKFFKNFMPQLTQTLKDGIGDIISAFIKGKDQTKDGDSPSERIEENIDEAKDLIETGNISEWIAPDGELDHMSGAKTNMLAHTPMYLKALKNSKVGKAVIGGAQKGIGAVKSVGSGIKSIASGVKSAAQFADDGIRLVKANGGIKNLYDTVKSFKSIGLGTTWKEALAMTAENSGTILKSTADDAGKVLLSATDDVAKLAASNKKGLISTVSDALRKFLSKIAEYLSKKGFKVGTNAGKNLIDDAIRVVAQHFPKISGKISAVVSSTAALGSTVVGLALKEGTWITLGAINGISGAARLFQVDQEYVDFKMRLISTAIGGFSGSTIGSIVDIVNELIVDVLGVDFVHELAVVFYHLIAGDEKYQKLKTGQSEFENKYNEYKNGEIEKQWLEYNQNNGTNLTLEEFKEGIDSDAIEVSYDSFADFNDKNHQTWGSKLYNRFGKPIVKGVGAVIDGGKKIISKGAEIGSNAINWVKNAPSKAKSAWNSATTWVGDKASTIGKWVGNKGVQLGTGVENAWNSASEWVTNTGTQIETKFSEAIETASSVFDDTKDGIVDILKLAITGKRDEMNKYKFEISEDNPLGGFVVNTVLGAEKYMLSPIVNFVSFGNTLADGIKSTISSVKDISSDIKNYITVLNKYTDPDKDISNYTNEQINGADTDPARLIVGAAISRVMKIYIDIMRGINKFGDWFGDKVEIAKEGFSNAKDWVSNGISSVGNKVSSFIRGGKGDTENNFPYYSQKDPRWGNISYDEGGKSSETIGDAGCGPDAMAMVATKMSGQKVTPIEVARDAKRGGYRDQTGTNWGFVDSAADKYGLQTSRVENPNKEYIQSELSKGRPVMLSGVGDGVSSPYTSQGHYVVAVGMSGNDVIVNDPRGRAQSGRYNLDSVANNTGAAWSFKKSNGGKGKSKNKIIRFPGGGRPDDGPTAEDTKLEKSRQLVVSTMMSLQGKLHYTMDSGTREKVIQGYAGDCSSTCRWVYKHALGIDPGTYTGAQISSSLGTDVDNTSGCPNEKNLLPGDLLFFAGKSGGVGHVEMYIGNGSVMGHGGPNWNDMGPTIKNLVDYCNARKNMGRPYMKARRFILPKNAEHITLNSAIPIIDTSNINYAQTSNSSTSSGSSSSSSNFFTKMGNFFSAFAEKAWNGLVTGNWDTDYSSVFNGTDSSSSLDSTSSVDIGNTQAAEVNINPGEIEKSSYEYFVKNGFSSAAAAGILGNIYQESKFNPALIQGNGKGPAAGLFQWENYNTKLGRWKSLYEYANSKNKAWTDLETQLAYALNEMDTTQKWMWAKNKNAQIPDNITSLDEYKKMTNPQEAAVAFQNHFERAGKPMNEVRMGAAQKYYDKYASSSVEGGRGGDNMFDVGSYNYFTPNQTKPVEDDNISFDSSVPRDTFRLKKESSKYKELRKSDGGKGSTAGLEGLLQQVVSLLTAISASSASSSEKLDMLKNISSGNNFTAISNNKQGSTIINNPIQTSVSDKLLGATKSRNETLANRIASGQ